MPVCLHEGKRKNVDLSGSSLHLGRVGGGETVIRIVIFFAQKYIFSIKKTQSATTKITMVNG